MQLLYSNACFIHPNNLLLQFTLPHPLFLFIFFPLFILYASFSALAISTVNLRLPLPFFSFLNYCFPYHPLVDSSLFLPPVSMTFIALSHSVRSYLHLVVAAFQPRENAPGNRLPFTSAKWEKMIAANWDSLILTGDGSHFELNKTAHFQASTELNENHQKQWCKLFRT